MEKKKSKKGLIAIVTLLVILILAVAIVIYFVLGGNNNTGTAWGDAYYAYLKKGLEETNEDEKQKYGLQTGVEKAELQFVETNKEEEPVKEEPTTKQCPFCYSEISIHATRCPYCTSVLEEKEEIVED